MNLFTNATTVVFWFFTRYCDRHYKGRRDTATNEQLTEKNRRLELEKVFQLPWSFWTVLAFSLFQTSTASVFSQNSTELAEQRFNVSAIKAGWYSSLSQYAGFFLVPCLGIFIDILGHRASVCEWTDGLDALNRSRLIMNISGHLWTWYAVEHGSSQLCHL